MDPPGNTTNLTANFAATSEPTKKTHDVRRPSTLLRGRHERMALGVGFVALMLVAAMASFQSSNNSRIMSGIAWKESTEDSVESAHNANLKRKKELERESMQPHQDLDAHATKSEQQQAKTRNPVVASKIGPNQKACYRAMVSGKMDYILQKLAKYVPYSKQKNATSSWGDNPRVTSRGYDPNFCSVLSPSYKRCNEPTGKLIFDTPVVGLTNNTVQRNQAICDVAAFAQEVGGPSGFAHRLLGQTHRQKFVYTVVLMGDSKLQQIWEALVCHWTHDVTGIVLQQEMNHDQGHVVAPQVMVSRQGKSIGQLLKTTNLTHAQSRCSTTVSRDAKPTTICNDEIAMVEFGNTIRFYFIDQPSLYSASELQNVTVGLRLDIRKMDQLILGGEEAEDMLQSFGWPSLLPQGVWESRIHWKDDVLQGWQKWNMQDCIPEGTQMDQANLLLLMLLKHKVGRRIAHTAFTVPRLPTQSGK